MATTTAWNDRYVPILRDTLGLRVEVRPDHLQVLTGAGLHYRLSSDPDTTPHYLQIAFFISLGSHTDLLTSHPQLLTDITHHSDRHRQTLSGSALRRRFNELKGSSARQPLDRTCRRQSVDHSSSLDE